MIESSVWPGVWIRWTVVDVVVVAHAVAEADRRQRHPLGRLERDLLGLAPALGDDEPAARTVRDDVVAGEGGVAVDVIPVVVRVDDDDAALAGQLRQAAP